MMGKDELNEIIALLEERVRVIGDVEMREQNPDGQLAKLQSVSEAITAFHRTHGGVIKPRLNHFLENCSYAKALEWANDALAKT